MYEVGNVLNLAELRLIRCKVSHTKSSFGPEMLRRKKKEKNNNFDLTEVDLSVLTSAYSTVLTNLKLL